MRISTIPILSATALACLLGCSGAESPVEVDEGAASLQVEPNAVPTSSGPFGIPVPSQTTICQSINRKSRLAFDSVTFAVYDENNQVRWRSATPPGAWHAGFSRDARLFIMTEIVAGPVWATPDFGPASNPLVTCQENGDVVISDGPTFRWSTGTAH